MTDDASTAYICIYCPFNSSNLQALEQHLTSISWTKCYLDILFIYSGVHGHGCQDTAQAQSPTNMITKTNKREAPDDEQVIFKPWFCLLLHFLSLSNLI